MTGKKQLIKKSTALDSESDGDVFDWIFTLNPTSYNGITLTCRGPISQALWFYGQIRNKGVFAAQRGYPYNRLLLSPSDMTITAMRTDNGQQDQTAVNNLIAHIGAVIV